MERGKLLYWADVGLGLSFFSICLTGIIKYRTVLNYLGMDWKSPLVQQISLVHDVSGVAVAVFALVHLLLHWKWIVATTKKILLKK